MSLDLRPSAAPRQYQTSWTGLIGHISRPGANDLTRVNIDDFMVYNSGVSGLRVRYSQSGSVQHKLVCPTMIAACSVLWHLQLAMSGSDDEGHEPVATYTAPLPSFTIDSDSTVCQFVSKQVRCIQFVLSLSEHAH